MIEYAIRAAFEKRIKRGYDITYWAIDIHDTIVPSTYTYPNNYDIEAYPCMIEAMQLLSSMPDHKIILWSCTTEEKIEELISSLKKFNITTDYFNENPECGSNDISHFDRKFYFDCLIDDKAGFNPSEDWRNILLIMKQVEEIGIEDTILYLKER